MIKFKRQDVPSVKSITQVAKQRRTRHVRENIGSWKEASLCISNVKGALDFGQNTYKKP